VTLDELGEALCQIGALDACAFYQAIGVDAGEHGASHRRRQRIATEGAAVAARGQSALELLLTQHCADGKASTQALGHCDGIGLHVGMLETEKAPGTSDARLNFVSEQ
jgi:hypothetical protein